MLEKKVEDFLESHGQNLRGKRILIGVSGGPDSLALLHYLWSRQANWGHTVMAAHVDHMFRGDESYAEAMFVKDFCFQRNIPFEMAQINVAEYMERTGKSSQTAARDCRYDFYDQVIKKHDIDLLALGHHGDDQIETILMRLTRGSTGMARAGILFKRPFANREIIRPFLCVSKQDIEDYCQRHDLEPRRDRSNEKSIYLRNRFRINVLPFLKDENPRVHEQFQRFSEELEDDEELLHELTVQKMKTVIKKKDPGEITIDRKTFRAMSMPLQRRGIQLILNYLYQEKPASLSAIHIDQVLSLFSSPHPSGTLDFPKDLKVVRSYDDCHFQFEKAERHPFYIEITKTGTVTLPNGGVITVETVEDCGSDNGLDRFCFQSGAVQFPIIVRTRKNGDRMSIKGMKGTKKIKAIFIDSKIPLSEREEWPIVTDKDGNIIWLPGLKKSSLPIKKSGDASYILLTYKKQ
ncbi:tRNA lysidine(34) synthetase TilS [Bacillus sp. V3-13]|uniref:tRNA lysidine(34) synthetase TilS n=1 Tax=Bacillus sp. V3-13 TaxID=2053728 RepID=UPI000C75B309|nr:tRNA lysidine(34) synthetase TilS [Bacillus sp. V3-13]PLR78923.1 tRNA lysidine(34) synthetase TilS [Bacillus sp. V3-13]